MLKIVSKLHFADMEAHQERPHLTMEAHLEAHKISLTCMATRQTLSLLTRTPEVTPVVFAAVMLAETEVLEATNVTWNQPGRMVSTNGSLVTQQYILDNRKRKTNQIYT